MTTTIPQLLAERRRHDGDRQAIVLDDASITYAELDDASFDVAARLVAAGVAKGDRVGLLAPNGIEWAVTAFGVLRIGAVLVPLSTLLRPPELEQQLRTAAVRHLVAAESYRNRRYHDDLATLDVPWLRAVWTPGGLPAERAPEEVVRALEARVTPADDLTVLFTSGSRGTPKGVVHTHGAALRAVAAGLGPRRVRPGERLYVPMPFFWTGGLSTGLLSAVVAGATLLAEADPEPGRTLRFLERERVTLFRGWPDQAARLAAHPDFAATDLSTLTDASLPAVLPAERRPAPGARANIFGMTETFGPYCGAPLDTDLPAGKEGSCGQPFEGVEVRIVDGEIHLRGPNLLRGFCGRTLDETFTPDGWYRTGDLGRLDDDGYLWYSGRLDDMFKVKGATVYPSEVEAALRSIPGVRQAHATDVDGEVGALVVTDLDVGALTAAARERLSAFKVPTRWHVTTDADAVPMLASAKVDKPALQRLLSS